jgi:WD40 repeat protein
MDVILRDRVDPPASSSLLCIACHPSLPGRLACGYDDGSIKVIQYNNTDNTTKQTEPFVEICLLAKKHGQSVNTLAWSPGAGK